MKILCVGLNYPLHNIEMCQIFDEEPEESVSKENPVLFLKPETALLPENQAFYIPAFSTDLHHELELVIHISKGGKNIDESEAKNHYQEITLGIDFTDRDLQTKLKAKGLPWELSKGFDNSAVIGKFIHKDALNKQLNELDFQLKKNEQVVQSANTSEMIHSIDEIIAFASKYFTLRAGDLLYTGTPAGVGSVHTGTHLEGILEGQTLLDFYIK